MNQPSEKYQEAVAALLQCQTETQACEQLNIARSTLHRWKQDPEFTRLLKEARQELYDHVVGQVQSAATEAVKTLRDIMVDRECPPSTRVTAAKSILDSVHRFAPQEKGDGSRRLTVADIIGSVNLDEDEDLHEGGVTWADVSRDRCLAQQNPTDSRR